MATAQSQSQYDKGTPPQFAAGVSPLGSYASADIGSVNLSNGALNLKLPLGTVGGRGLSLPLTLNWSSKIWSASIDYDAERGCGRNGCDDPNPSMVPVAYADYANADTIVNYSSRIEAGWTIGGMPFLIQRVVRINYTNIQPRGPCYDFTLPKLTLMMPDRGEIEFRDDAYDGAPLPGDCGGWTATASRGRRWHATDGSGLIYLNDSDNGAAGRFPDLTGVVTTSDGTRFYLNSGGGCYLIMDRNGNKISMSANGIVDPLGRTTTIQQNVSDPENPSETLAVLVTVTGYNALPRYYKVRSGIMNQHYRSDINPTLPVVTGSYDPMSWGYNNWWPASATRLFPLSYGLYAQRIDDRPVISELILPDHRSLHFNYNQFGEVAEVQMPTGGKVWYDYGYDGALPSGNSPVFETSGDYHTTVPGVDRALLQRRIFSDGSTLEGTWNYSYGSSSATVTASAPDGTLMLNQAHFFLPAGRYTDYPLSITGGHDGTYYNLWSTGIEWRTETRNASGAIIAADEQDWTQRAAVSWSTYPQEQPANDNRVNEERKILDDGSTAKVHTYYQPNVKYNNPSDVREFDFDQALKRRTVTTYADSSNLINGLDYTSDSIHLLNLPLVTTVYDGNNNQAAQIVNEYDIYADDTNHAPLQDYGAVTQHDINFGPSNVIRGNLTRAGRWLNLPNSFIYSYPRYDDLGNVVSAKDPNGKVATVSFADDFGDGHNPGAGAAGTFGATYALPTVITSPAPTPGAPVQTAYSQYDFSTGLLTGFKDRNGIISQTFYSDPFNRPTLVKTALGISGVEAHASMYYAPATAFGITLTNNDVLTAKDQNTIDDSVLRAWTHTDGFGRTVESWSRDPQGDDKVITIYDALGRGYKQSNPFRPSLGEPANYTTTAFDFAGRVTSVTTPDSAAVTSSYAGNTVTVTDQHDSNSVGHSRKSVTDGLGRLIKVYEAPNDSNFNYLTTYDYDALDNLTTVTQGRSNGTDRGHRDCQLRVRRRGESHFDERRSRLGDLYFQQSLADDF